MTNPILQKYGIGKNSANPILNKYGIEEDQPIQEESLGSKLKNLLLKETPAPESISVEKQPSTNSIGETISSLMPHRILATGAQAAIDNPITQSYLKEGQAAMKLFAVRPDVALGISKNITPEQLSLTEKDWGDIIRKSYPQISEYPSEKWPEHLRYPLQVGKEFATNISGEILGAGTKPSTWITWYGIQKIAPPLLNKALEKMPKGMREFLTKERSFIDKKLEDAYKTLGIKSNSPLREIKQSYNQAALKYHPDRPGGGNVNEFIKANQSYDLIIKSRTTPFQKFLEMFRSPTETPVRTTGEVGLLGQRGSALIPFNEGDIVKLGEQTGKFIKRVGEGALINIAGKEITAKLADLQPLETKPEAPSMETQITEKLNAKQPLAPEEEKWVADKAKELGIPKEQEVLEKLRAQAKIGHEQFLADTFKEAKEMTPEITQEPDKLLDFKGLEDVRKYYNENIKGIHKDVLGDRIRFLDGHFSHLIKLKGENNFSTKRASALSLLKKLITDPDEIRGSEYFSDKYKNGRIYLREFYLPETKTKVLLAAEFSGRELTPITSFEDPTETQLGRIQKGKLLYSKKAGLITPAESGIPARVIEDSKAQNLPQQAVSLGVTAKPLTPKSEPVAFAPSPTLEATLPSAIKSLPQEPGIVKGIEPPMKPPVKPPTAISGEPAPEKPRKPITPARIKPDISGITPLQKEIKAMESRQDKVGMANAELEELEKLRDILKRRIVKFKDDRYLKEEMSGIPSIYYTRGEGLAPDEALDELRRNNIELNSVDEMRDFLRNLEEQRQALRNIIEENKPGFITRKETTILANKIKAVETGLKEGKIQSRKEIKNVQTQLIEIIEESGLEAKDRAKFMRLLKNIQTVTQMKSIVPEIADRLQSLKSAAERREAISDIKDLFSRQATKDLPLDYRDKIEVVMGKLEPRQFAPKTRAKIESMRQFVERMAAQGEEINIPEEKLALLDKTSLDTLSVEELKDLREAVERLYHLGKLKNKLLTVQKERAFDEVVKEGVSNITKGKGITEEDSITKALREQHRGLSLEGIKGYIAENMRPELMVNLLDKNRSAVNTDVIWNSLWEAEKNKINDSNLTLDKIKDIHKGLKLDKLNKPYNLGRFKGLTKDNAMFVYANSFNEHNRAHLIGSGITDEEITLINNSLTPEERKAVEGMIKFYDTEQYPGIDKVYSELEGVHLPKEKSYFPIDRVEDVSFNKELEQNILEANYIRKAGVTKGFTKERVASKKGYGEMSYINAILRNWQKVEHYKAYAKSIRDVNKYLSSPEVKAAIKQNFGDSYYQTLEKWLKDVAFQGGKKELGIYNNLAKWLRTNYATSVLGLNLISSMKQPVSFLQGMEMAGKGECLKSLSKFLVNPMGMIRFTESKSPLLKYRMFSQERELREIVSQRTTAQKLGKVTGYQAIREKSMLPLQAADKVTVTVIWDGAYHAALGKGLGEKEAVDFADKVIRRTQPMAGILHLPGSFRGDNVQKLLTLFRNQPNQNFNLLLESTLKAKAGEQGPGKTASNLAFYILIPAFIMGMISRKRTQDNLNEFSKDILNQALGGLYLYGNIFNWLANDFKGELTPIESYLSDIYTMASAQKTETKAKAALDVFAAVTGLPVLGVRRILTGQLLGGKRTGNKSFNLNFNRKETTGVNPILEKYKIQLNKKTNPILEKYGIK